MVDNSSNGTAGNIPARTRSKLAKVVAADVRDGGRMRNAVEGVDAVVHLAAQKKPRPSPDGAWDLADNNVRGTMTLLEACAEAAVGRFIFASSAAIYGDGGPPEGEDSPIRPISPYGVSKALSESFCDLTSRRSGIETVILRLFNVYGRKGGGFGDGVVGGFAASAASGKPLVVYGDGRQTRDFIHVDDVAAGIELALETRTLAGGVFNLGTGVGTRVNDLALRTSRLAGRTSRIVHRSLPAPEIRHSRADTARAARVLRFRANVPLASGLRRLFTTGVG